MKNRKEIQNDLVTVKYAARLCKVKPNTVHYWLTNDKAAGIHVGQGGYPYATSLDGRVIYHNLVSLKDCFKLAKILHAKRKAAKVSNSLLILSTTDLGSRRKSAA